MDKFNLGTFAEAVKDVGVKTASALRELLDAKNAETAGTLNAKERLEMLFDNGTFSELGAYVGRAHSENDTSYEFESVICGWGAVNGRLVYAFSQDISRTSGAVSETHSRKIINLYRLAMENGAPVVALFDSAGAYIPEGVSALAGYGRIMKAVSSASGVIPQIAIAAGNVTGASAVICGMFDLVIKTSEATLAVNPPFNTDTDGKADLGVTALSVNGTASAIASAREILVYLPSNNCEGTPCDVSADDVNRTVSLDGFYSAGGIRELIKSVADDGKLFELYSDYAGETLGALASIGGVSVGFVATDHAVNGGRLTAKGARKLSRLVSLFDTFNLPVVTIVDSEGIDTSASSEVSPLASELAKLASAYAAASTPLITVIAGEAYGSLFTVMGSKSLGADIVYALEDAKIAAMNAHSAVAFLYNDKITAENTREKLEAEWNDTVATPVCAAASGEIDAIVEPYELRQRIASAVMMLSSKSTVISSRKHLVFPL